MTVPCAGGRVTTGVPASPKSFVVTSIETAVFTMVLLRTGLTFGETSMSTCACVHKVGSLAGQTW